MVERLRIVRVSPGESTEGSHQESAGSNRFHYLVAVVSIRLSQDSVNMIFHRLFGKIQRVGDPYLELSVNKSLTDSLSCLGILPNLANEVAFMPRSIIQCGPKSVVPG